MCHPIAIPLIIGVAQAGLQIHAQRQQAKAQNATRKIAIAEANRNFSIQEAGRQQADQERAAAAAQQGVEDQIAVQRARGSARARFADSGVSGGALQSVLAEFARQGGRSAANRNQSLRFSGATSELNRQAGFSRTVRATEIGNPRANFGALDIGTAVLGGASTGLSIAGSTGLLDFSGSGSATKTKNFRR